MAEQSNKELIKKRYSCRSYTDSRLTEEDLKKINKIISSGQAGPFGSKVRYHLTAAANGDSASLKDLGTYGFIKNPAAFIIGAVNQTGMFLEDFGYLTEKIILKATAMNIGTCWLGGTFKKSSFAERIGLKDGEALPAVISLGYIAEKENTIDRVIKTGAGSKKRLPIERIIFNENLNPLGIDTNSGYGTALEMLRLSPSANNKQPWRIIKDRDRNTFRFYLDRSFLYKATSNMFKIADLQRIDMGIAMSHFELTAIEYNLTGHWEIESDPGLKSAKGWQYTATWFGE